MRKEQQSHRATEVNRLREHYNRRLASERPIPYSVAKAYRRLIAAHEGTAESDHKRVHRSDPETGRDSAST